MDYPPDLDARCQEAAAAIRSADAILIGAGAGMGIDSGLPDYRGPEGFWTAHPIFRGRMFADIATPHLFDTDPALAWEFYGHRQELYRSVTPHNGFGLLLGWCQSRPHGGFVFTSNIDGQFQKAGFPAERVVERHGSIHLLQCSRRCGRPIWSIEDMGTAADGVEASSAPHLRFCPACGAIARPNVLMFRDREWDQARYAEQVDRYEKWISQVRGMRFVAIELGAGLAVPTIRCECEGRGQFLIRINPSDADPPSLGVALPLGALDALRRIDALLN